MRTRGITTQGSGLFRGSFSLRLSLYILLVTTVIFVVTLVVTFRAARREVQSEVINRTEIALDNTILRIGTILQEIETTIAGSATMVAEAADDAEEMYAIVEQVVRSNNNIVGSAIAFIPHYYSHKGLYFAPYAYRNGASIESKQLGDDDYDYFAMEWYSVPMNYGLPYWSEPYHDLGGADTLIATYSYPLSDEAGRTYAIFTADISIESFAHEVKRLKPYAGAYNFMLSRRGAFLAHSRHEALSSETVFENAVRFNEPELATLANKMIALERGIAIHQRHGIEYYVLYAPVANTGWSIAVACPYTDIFSSIYQLRDSVVRIFIVGIILIVGLSYIVIRRLTLPLKRLTLAAREIAAGHFDSPTPTVKGRDEMRQLRESFENMRTSLIAYIDKLQTTTAQKERMASDLRVAHNIQLGMLPRHDSTADYSTSVVLASRLIPAKEVGGDLYNYFIENRKLYFIVGDVSGKGVPAALVMAVVCRMFRTVASVGRTPSTIMSMLNRVLAENNDSYMFVTAFVGILDLESGMLQYANAGHNPPIIYGGNAQPYYLTTEQNIALGIIDDFAYSEGECRIERGSHLLIYTDGVTEATNVDGALYGEERLQELLSECTAMSPNEVVDTIVMELQAFSRGAEQSDDITILDIELKR